MPVPEGREVGAAEAVVGEPDLAGHGDGRGVSQSREPASEKRCDLAPGRLRARRSVASAEAAMADGLLASPPAAAERVYGETGVAQSVQTSAA